MDMSSPGGGPGAPNFVKTLGFRVPSHPLPVRPLEDSKAWDHLGDQLKGFSAGADQEPTRPGMVTFDHSQFLAHKSDHVKVAAKRPP